MAVGVWATDLAGRTTFVNSAMTELLGLPAAEVEGRSMSDFVDEEPEAVAGVLGVEPERRDRRLARRDGGEVWVAMSSAPMVDERGRRRGTLSTAVEVTERRRREVRLRERAVAVGPGP